MARAVIYQQLNQQAAAMAYQDIYRLLSWMAMSMVACAFISEQEQAWARSSCRRSDALATYLAI
jgi:hypothetical protein